MGRKPKMAPASAVDSTTGLRSIRGVCNDCGESVRLVFADSPVHTGGTRCRGCGRFDNFSAEYEIDGQKLGLVTLHSIEGMNMRFVVNGGNSDKVQEFFALNKGLEHWEFKNILVDASLVNGDKFHSRFIEDKEQQIKHEKFIAAKLKAFLKK
jgi:hypothetical protein